MENFPFILSCIKKFSKSALKYLHFYLVSLLYCSLINCNDSVLISSPQLNCNNSNSWCLKKSLKSLGIILSKAHIPGCFQPKCTFQFFLIQKYLKHRTLHFHLKRTSFWFLLSYLKNYNHAIEFVSEINIKIIIWKLKFRDALCNI